MNNSALDLFFWGTTVAKCLILLVVLIHIAPVMAWVERRGSAMMQNRLGPNRVGPFGLLQSAADGLKFIFKEDPIPGHVAKFYYVLAPLASMVPAFMTFAVIPFASSLDIGDRTVNFQVADLNVGFLYIFAVASLGVYGIIMGGWASNNKYALLGSLRSSSQMISYELSMGLSIVGLVMVFSSVHLQDMVMGEQVSWIQLGSHHIPKWGIFIQPLGFIIFLTAVFAETNRLPFDLPEGESEIVAGYHLEYGSMKFALFMMAEYVNMFTASGLLATFYFGGWGLWPIGGLLPLIREGLHLSPFAGEVLRVLMEFGVFTGKTLFFMWFFVWVRWTLPRFRYDQLMDLGWKVMLPLSLINIFLTGIAIYYRGNLIMLVKEKKSFIAEFYLREVIKGPYITMKNMLFAPKITIQYPEERRKYSERFRGQHYIKATNGVENCTACMLCPTVCPAECIHIEAGERADKEKYPVKFEIDLLRCCFCGMCEEACPKDAIKLSNIYEMSVTRHEIYDKNFLLEQRGNK